MHGDACGGQVVNRTAHIVEWDLPAQADASPGAMVVDTQGHDKNRLWFVTRLGVPRVFRLDPSKSLMKGNAQWKSWELSDLTFTTGGLRKIRASWDRRFVFVRGSSSIQRIDTQDCDATTCARTEWQDQVGSLNVSDLSVDDQNHVFTTGSTGGDPFAIPPAPPTNPEDSYVQMFTPSTGAITRWKVGGGAGFCGDVGSTTTSFPCISGIAVHPSNRNLLYFSEPVGQDGNGNISELNISTNSVRRWKVASVTSPDMTGGTVRQPRQLLVDKWGVVWVVTGSGHLVSLDPCRNQMRAHTIPAAMLSDPFGLAPDDDVVGYTDAGNNKIGMLFPKGPMTTVYPTTTIVPRNCTTQTGMSQRANFTAGSVSPTGKIVDATITTKTDGVFVEAQLNTGSDDSMSPLGITANKGKGQGTFFFAVGFNPGAADRVGFVRMPMPQKVRHPRDDDDNEDGWDHNQHPSGWHTGNDNGNDDDDDDGLDNTNDSPTAQENVQVIDDAPAIPGGQYVEYPMTTSPTSLALIATSTADNALAQIGIEVYNPNGLLVATSAPTPGVAVAPVLLPTVGTYRVRIRNYGVLPITHTPKLIVREPWADH